MSSSTHPSYAVERDVALAAVRRACSLTHKVFQRFVVKSEQQGEVVSKADESPVTVADLAAQSLLAHLLHGSFPQDSIIGEEDSGVLRGETPEVLHRRQRVVGLVNESVPDHLTEGQVLDAIDLGKGEGGPLGRHWTIDPIDGTKGFLRGEQYAVCVSLIVDAQVQVGVIGCPNLPAINSSDPNGAIFVAIRGQGAEQYTLSDSEPPVRLPIPSSDDSSLRLLESVEAAHSSHSFTNRVSQSLGITLPPIRMDSQAKYGVLARGGAGYIYLRMPTGVGYREKIWDHAPGWLLVQEAGGRVTDSRGKELNFGLGRTLGENFGVVGCAEAGVHEKILKAIREVKEVEKE